MSNIALHTPSRSVARTRRRRRTRLFAALAALIVVFGGLYAVPAYFIAPMINTHVDFPETFTAEQFGLTAEQLEFTTEDGLKIAAWSVKADNPANPKAVVIFLSGIHRPSVTAFYPHAAMLQKHGFASVLVEMRAHGQSEGKKITAGVKEYLDVKAAVQYIGKKYSNKDIIVYGLSMGAATAINAFGELPEIDGLISLSAFSSWTDAVCGNMRGMGVPEIFVRLERPFIDAFCRFNFGNGSQDVQPVKEIAKQNGRPVLLMHSKEDSQSPFSCFEKLSEAAPNAETYVRGGDAHFIVEGDFLHPEQDADYSSAVLDFLDRHFP